MHCLPVRRNMIVTDEVIESPRSLVIPEAANREISAQVVLKRLLEGLKVMERITVVKIGGNVIDDPAAPARLPRRTSPRCPKGRRSSSTAAASSPRASPQQLELQVQMVDGRRITDKGTLDVVTMVYAGLVNKQLVAGLQAAGCNAPRAVGRRRQRRHGTPPRTRTDRLRLRGRHRKCQPHAARGTSRGRRHARILRHYARRAGHAAQLQRRQRGFVRGTRCRPDRPHGAGFLFRKKRRAARPGGRRRRSSAKSRPNRTPRSKPAASSAKG